MQAVSIPLVSIYDQIAQVADMSCAEFTNSIATLQPIVSNLLMAQLPRELLGIKQLRCNLKIIKARIDRLNSDKTVLRSALLEDVQNILWHLKLRKHLAKTISFVADPAYPDLSYFQLCEDFRTKFCDQNESRFCNFQEPEGCKSYYYARLLPQFEALHTMATLIKDCRMDSARVMLAKMMVYDDRQIEHLVHIRLMCGKELRFPQSIEDYMKILLELIPDNTCSHYVLGILNQFSWNQKESDPQKALQMFEEAYKRAPSIDKSPNSSMKTDTLCRIVALKRTVSPQQALELLNAHLIEKSSANVFVTMVNLTLRDLSGLNGCVDLAKKLLEDLVEGKSCGGPLLKDTPRNFKNTLIAYLGFLRISGQHNFPIDREKGTNDLDFVLRTDPLVQVCLAAGKFLLGQMDEESVVYILKSVLLIRSPIFIQPVLEDILCALPARIRDQLSLDGSLKPS